MKKLYVLIRADLSKSQQAVQAGHAVAEWMLHDHAERWRNETLIYLSTRDEEELDRWNERLDQIDIAHVSFQEADLEHQTTAIAAYDDG